jgi:hypothetical protein
VYIMIVGKYLSSHRTKLCQPCAPPFRSGLLNEAESQRDRLDMARLPHTSNVFKAETAFSLLLPSNTTHQWVRDNCQSRLKLT